MSKAKFYAARELIEEKRYEEARTLLQTISDPKATEWIKKLDERTKPNSNSFNTPIYSSEGLVNPKSPPNYPLFPLVSCLGLGLFALINHDVILFLLVFITGMWFLIALNRYEHAKAEVKRETHYRKLQQIEQIKYLSPVEFENFVGYLFERMGYRVSTTAVTGDHGVDLFATKFDEKAVVQCKRYEGTVGEPIIRDLYGTMMHYHMDKAYLVTTGSIAKRARTWSIDKPIELIDGTELQNWVQKIENSFISNQTSTPSPTFKFRFQKVTLSPPILKLRFQKATFAFIICFIIAIFLVGIVLSNTSNFLVGIVLSNASNSTSFRSTAIVQSSSITTPKPTSIPVTASPSTSEKELALQSQLSDLNGINSVQQVIVVGSADGYTIFINATIANDHVDTNFVKIMLDVARRNVDANVVQFIVFLDDGNRIVNYVWTVKSAQWTVSSRDK